MVISTLKNLWKPARSIVCSHITEARTTGQLQRGSSSTLLSQFSGGQVSVVDSGRQDQWRSGYVGRSFDPVISYTLNPFPSSIWVQFINYSGINRNDAPPRIFKCRYKSSALRFRRMGFSGEPFLATSRNRPASFVLGKVLTRKTLNFKSTTWKDDKFH